MQSIIAQEETYSIPDSLSSKTYDYLFRKTQQIYQTDSITSLIYIKTYLAKAILEDNSQKKVNGYKLVSYYTKKKDVKFFFIEKALGEVENVSDINKIYFYIYVGTVYHQYFDYETAIAYYLKALKIAEKNNNEEAKYILFNNIAKIKEDLGKHEEALSLYKKNLVYEILQKDTIGSIGTTINIAESMRNLKKHDSASYYYHSVVDRVYKESHRYKGFLTIGEGINLFYKKNYIEAEQLLQKGSSEIDFMNFGQRKSYILSQLYLGKIQLTHYHDTEKAKAYFTEVDSLVSRAKAVIPETIGAYEFLINYYDENGNVEKQLDVVTKLYLLRTAISSRKINTVEMLHSEFDTPELLKSKELLIQKLENKTNSLNTRTFYLIVFIVLLLALSMIQYNKHRKYKKRFNAIILELNTKKTKKVSHNNLSISPQLASVIDEATVTAIVKKIRSF